MALRFGSFVVLLKHEEFFFYVCLLDMRKREKRTIDEREEG